VLHQQFLDQQVLLEQQVLRVLLDLQEPPVLPVQLVLVDRLPITALSKITMTKQPQPLIRLMQ
jgi:hypothetical protein